MNDKATIDALEQAYEEDRSALIEAQRQWDKPMNDGTGSGLDGRSSSLGFDPYVEYRKKRKQILEKHNILIEDYEKYCIARFKNEN